LIDRLTQVDLRRLCSSAVLGGPPLAWPDVPAPIRYNFDAGYPAPEALPVEQLRALAAKVLDDPAALGYVSLRYDATTGEPIYQDEDFVGRADMTLGNLALREELATWVRRRQSVRDLDSSNFVVTSGASQAIALAAAAFIDPGDGAIVESLTFAYGFKSLQMRGADVRMAAVDDRGLVIESLEEQLRELDRDGVRLKLLYVIPTFHLPTGAVMPLDRRLRVLELAEEWDFLVVEDAVYSDLRYDGDPVPPTLLNLDTSGRVLQAHSLSKIVATGLRLGWMCGPSNLIDALGVVREDLGVSQWLARIAAEFMRQGELDPHIERACQIYRSKRDAAASGLRESCGELIDFVAPNGGIFMWVHLDDAVDWQLAKRQAALDGVAVREAAAFSMVRDTERVSHFRLGFGHGSLREIETGTALLGQAISAAARDRVH
jgi:2-aminoadipate transaminase